MHVGHRFERHVRWSREEIVRYADLVGDSNPLHHDAAYASGTRFGGLIASGAQTVAYLMALCASQTTTANPGVGLEFNFRLVGPAKPDDDIRLCWEVSAPKERSSSCAARLSAATGARSSRRPPVPSW